MKRTNIYEAKANLSKLVDQASKGEEIIICKAGVPMAILKPYKNEKKGIAGLLGVWEGKVEMAEDFDILPEEFMRYFK